MIECVKNSQTKSDFSVNSRPGTCPAWGIAQDGRDENSGSTEGVVHFKQNGLPMVKQDRISRRVTALLESLETRSLLSLISAPPTLEVLPSPGVRFNREGGISITQPAAIHVYGTAQPGAPGTTVQVSIYAEDSEGNLVNGGAPLATVTPDFLGKYSAVVSLPSMLRKDVNFLVARETASATETASLTINGTTVNNLSGSVQVDPGTLTGLTGSVSNPSTTVTGVGGTITTPSTPISNLGGTITTPVYPISTPSARVRPVPPPARCSAARAPWEPRSARWAVEPGRSPRRPAR